MNWISEVTKIDFHVNLLPEFALENVSSAAISDESAHLKHCFDLPITAELNRLCTASHIIAAMDEANVQRSVVFSYQWKNPLRCNLANATVAAALRSYPRRLLGLAVVQPRDSESLGCLESWLDVSGMIGVKMKPRWGDFSLSDLSVMGPLCETLIAKGKILLTHISQGFHAPTGDQISDLVTLLRAFPQLKVVAAHLGGFIGVYECYKPMQRVFDNLYIDVSLPANLLWLPHLMRLGDSNRYLYATDWPYSTYADFDSWLAASGLTDNELEQVMSANPLALLQDLGIN